MAKTISIKCTCYSFPQTVIVVVLDDLGCDSVAVVFPLRCEVVNVLLVCIAVVLAINVYLCLVRFIFDFVYVSGLQIEY